METKVSASPEAPELNEYEKWLKKVQRRERGVKRYQWFVFEALILLLIIWAVFFLILGVTRMPSGDMFPRVNFGDMVVLYRLDKDMQNQDVIAFEKIDDNGQRLVMVSRVVAGPGDTVTYTEEGALIVNGNRVSEPDIYYRGTQYRGDSAPTYPIVLGSDECFVLGDRRDQAYDSRTFGPVKQREIIGTVITILRRNSI